jgi:hypothetical protein
MYCSVMHVCVKYVLNFMYFFLLCLFHGDATTFVFWGFGEHVLGVLYVFFVVSDECSVCMSPTYPPHQSS